jgi:HlyD family secretion protein
MKLRTFLAALTLAPLVALLIPLRLQHHNLRYPTSEPGAAVAEQSSDNPSHAARLIAAPGFVEPVSELITVSASAVGRLLYLKAEEGQSLHEGDVVGEIENGDVKAELAAAEADLKIRQSELARLNAGARDQERGQAAAALREAQATASLTKIQLDRQRLLLVDKAVSRAALDQAQSDFEAADARRKALAEKLSLVEAPPRDEDAAIAQAQVDAAVARIAAAQGALDKTIIKSPIEGVVLRRYQKPGEMMALLPPTPIFEIADMSQLRVRAQIDEADVGRVVVGQEVWITADAYGNRRFRGHVSQLGLMMGPKNFRTDKPGEKMDTKLLEAVVDLEPDVKMPIGLRVDVLFTDQVNEARIAPTNAEVSQAN